MSSKLEDLKMVIVDDNLPISARQAAAEHVIGELVDSVPTPPQDDPEVVNRMKPWKDQRLAELVRGATGTAKLGGGASLSEAREDVHKRNRLRAVLAVVVDTSAHRLLRLAACAWVLAEYGFINKWHLNHYTAERLLETVLPPDATTITNFFDPPVQVKRRPQELRNVWTL